MKTTNENSSYDSNKDILSKLNEILFFLNEKQPMSDWLSLKQAMQFIGYKETKMRELVNSGLLTFSSIGSKKFIKKSDLNQFLENNKK